MAQANYTPISLYYSTTASAAPSAGNLVNGELAINITDGKLYYKDNAGVVQIIGTKGGTGSSSNTQVLFNSSGLVAGSAGLTWDGTKITTTGLSNTGNTTLGDATADTLTINALMTSNFLFTDDTYSIGASGANRPKNLYLSANMVAGASAYVLGDGGLTGTFAGIAQRYISGSNASYIQSVSVTSGTATGKSLFLDGTTVSLRYISGSNFVDGLTVTSTGVGIKTITSPAVALDNGGGAAILANTTTIDPDSNLSKVVAGTVADGSGFSGIGLGFVDGSAGQLGAIVQGGSTTYFGIGNGSSANSMQTWLQVSRVSGGVIFNNPQLDLSFKVKSVNNASMLFVDASNDQVVIGGSSAYANSSLTVYRYGTSAANNAQITLDANANSGSGQAALRLLAGSGTTNRAARIDFLNGVSSTTTPIWTMLNDYQQDGTNDFNLISGSSNRRMVLNSTETAFNVTQSSVDFRVLSPSSGYAIYLKASNSYTGFGTNTPIRPLHVYAEGVSGTQVLIQSPTNSAGIQMTSNSASGRTYEIQSDTNGSYIEYDRTADRYTRTTDSSGNTEFLGNLLSVPGTSVNMLTGFSDGRVGFVDPTSSGGWGVSNGVAGRTGNAVWALGSNGASTVGGATVFFGVGSISAGTMSSAWQATTDARFQAINNPFAFVKVAADYTAVSGQNMRFNSVSDSRGLSWDTSNYGFTAPCDGVYAISIGVRLEVGTLSYQYYQVEVNGSNLYNNPHFLGMAESGSQGFSTVSVSTIVKLSRNDVVRFPYHWDGAGNTTVYSGQTWCAVAMIS